MFEYLVAVAAVDTLFAFILVLIIYFLYGIKHSTIRNNKEKSEGFAEGRSFHF